MSLGLPIFGQPGYQVTEDLWMPNSQAASLPSEITIGCQNKHHEIYGMLAGPLRINGQSEWESAFGGGIMSLAGSALDSGNQLMQFSSSVSIQQPWMNRKTWKTTKPFTFSIDMSFVATNSEKEDVWDPCVTLLSFIYPREITLKNDSGNSLTLKHWAESRGGTISKIASTIDDNTVVGNALNMVQLYQIPGPGIRWSESRESKSGSSTDVYSSGDPVYVHIGNMVVLNGVYLEKVDIQFSNAVGMSGYPIAAKASVMFSMMDACYVTRDGNLRGLSSAELGDSTKSIAGFLNKASDTVEHAVQGITKALSIGFTAYGKEG